MDVTVFQQDSTLITIVAALIIAIFYIIYVLLYMRRASKLGRKIDEASRLLSRLKGYIHNSEAALSREATPHPLSRKVIRVGLVGLIGAGKSSIAQSLDESMKVSSSPDLLHNQKKSIFLDDALLELHEISIDDPISMQTFLSDANTLLQRDKKPFDLIIAVLDPTALSREKSDQRKSIDIANNYAARNIILVNKMDMTSRKATGEFLNSLGLQNNDSVVLFSSSLKMFYNRQEKSIREIVSKIILHSSIE